MVRVAAFAGFRTGFHSRVLATLLFSDLVDSTATGARLGDDRWRGLLATYDNPVRALHCAEELRAATNRRDLHLRVGLHVGEVELVGSDVRGVAVHQAARITAAANSDEILVSDLTRVLATGLTFADRGVHQLKGLAGDWALAALVPSG